MKKTKQVLRGTHLLSYTPEEYRAHIYWLAGFGQVDDRWAKQQPPFYKLVADTDKAPVEQDLDVDADSCWE